MSTSHIVIDKVVVKDEDGNGYKLKRLGVGDIQGDPEEIFDGGGIPRYFDLRGPDIYLYPTPNYTEASGLVVYFRTGLSAFASTDTTKQPGFASVNHEAVSLEASASYAEDNAMESAASLRARADRRIASLQKFTSKRGRDSATVIRPRRQRYR